MNIFSAITVLVVVFGACAGAFVASFIFSDFAPAIKIPILLLVGLAFAFLAFKSYLYFLRKMDERAKRKKGKT